jgi:NADH:ubiquinone oxidoreductase subunit B-like Fe-S oxidoreductase
MIKTGFAISNNTTNHYHRPIYHRSFDKVKLQFQAVTLWTCKITIACFHISMVVNGGGEIGVHTRKEIFNG